MFLRTVFPNLAELSRMAVLLVSILPIGDIVHCSDLDLVGNHAHSEMHSHSGWVPLFHVASSPVCTEGTADRCARGLMHVEDLEAPEAGPQASVATNHSTGAPVS